MQRFGESVWLATVAFLWIVGVTPLCAVTPGFLWADDARPVQQTYYVDAERGSDSNPGSSPETAWRSLERLHGADLQPGDTVRFKSGGVWRGSLLPASGEHDRPVTYTAYGEGPKPLLLGSRPRNRHEDWIEVRENLWATLPMEYRLDEQVLDLRHSSWGRHQEAGADVRLTQAETEEGTLVTFACGNSGQASNHVQVWGPAVAIEQGKHFVFSFRARSSKPFRPGAMSLRQSGSPWTSFASARALDHDIGPEWQSFDVVFQAEVSAEAARLHINLGGVLPADAVFELEPLSLHQATPSVLDPLSVDVGNLIFDDGKVCGWKKWSLADLNEPYDYFYEPSSWRVYVNCPANPASLHHRIELALKRHVVDQGGVHHVVYDGLEIRNGAAHGFGGGTHHIIIRNCDLSYIGGGHQTTRADGHPVRYGNAIEFWGNAHDHLVENCRIWEVYDAALTNQNKSPDVRQENITYRNNVIWNCEYSFEYWNRPESSTTRNIRFVHNTCVNAGTVWSHAQRPDQNGSHLMFYSNSADTAGFEVKYNIFCHVTEWGSRYSSGWKQLPEMDHNLWYSEQGVTANWFGEKIADFHAYQQRTGLDANSHFADPQFVDPANCDFRLSPGSTVRMMGPDGIPVGADTPSIRH